jgi:hypothetical protein
LKILFARLPFLNVILSRDFIMFHCDRYSLFPVAYSLPILALEVVSRNYRKEYTDKLDEYADLGLLYYVI